MPGFGGREVSLRRVSEQHDKVLIVDAVKLATNADREADALVSKLLRIMEAGSAESSQSAR